ncbi:hypothetical protein Tco_1294090 [Tanacetum coccineum]
MTSQAQQIALDNELVAPKNRHTIDKCNMRMNTGMKPKEPTYQVALDALALTTCYPAFLITAEVPVSGKDFDEPPTEEEALSFIHELGHSGEIRYITDVVVDHLHQPWRTFKNLDFVALIWGDLAYQINNIDSKKQDKMFYPRFTKIIIHHFLTKDKSISWRNKMFMHTARDDSVLGTIRFVSKHENTQVYGAIVPKAMTNQSLLDFVAYNTYHAIASGAEPLMPRKGQKKSDSTISSEESPSKKNSAKAKKVTTTKPKPSKKKASVKADRGKGDGTDFESGVPDEQHLKTTGVDKGIGTIPGVLDVPKYDFESEKESWGDSGEEDKDDENDSEDKSDDGDNDDDDDANDDDNQKGDDTNDDDEETDSDITESDIIKIHVLNQSSTEYYEEDEEKIDDEETIDDKEDDKVTKELYKDVNVNLGNKDTEMTNVDQGGSEQQNVSQESGFEQVEEDVHVTLTPVLDTQKADEPVQSSSISSNFTSKLRNLENPSPADNEIASLMETLARHATTIPEIISDFTITIPPPPPQEAQDEKNDYKELVDTSMRAIIKEEVNTQLPQILPQAVSDFATPVREKNVTEPIEASVLARSSSQLKSTYEVAASLFEFELIKILLDKMEESKSHLRADYKKKLYDALVESYNIDKDLFNTYGEVFTLKRSRDDRDKNQDPSAGSDRGTKRRKSSKEAESSKDSSHTINDSGVQQDQEFDMGNNDEQPADKEVSKADWFKKPERPPTPDSDWNKRQHVDSRPPQTWISQVAHAKEPHTSFDKLMDTSFDFLAFATIEQLDWHNPEGKPYPFDLSKPLLLIRDHRGRQVIPQDFFINKDLEYLKGGDLSRRYSTSVTKTKAATYDIKCIKDLVQNLWSPVKVTYDKHAYWGTSHWGSKRQYFYGFAANMSSSKDVYSRKRIIAVTRLTIMKKYDYGHLEEIEVRREDQKLYKFREGDFPRLRLQDIEDMLLLLVQKKLANLIIDKQSNLINKTTYTTNSDLKGVIYKDQNNRNRLMCADELHKFSDGTLDDVRSALNDIAKGIRMEYLPKRKWSGLEKQRARVMV